MFYTFDQNNSGGSWDYDAARGITHRVIVEADSPDEANDRAEAIGLYFNGVAAERDCECCGDRWSPMWSGEKGTTVPEVYGTAVLETKKMPRNGAGIKWMGNKPEVFIHYKDNRIVKAWTKSE